METEIENIPAKRPRGRPRKIPLTPEQLALIPKKNVGGARVGAGRPKGSIAESTRKGMIAREAFAKLVEKNVQEVFDTLFTAMKRGDINAAKELLDRAWGKAKQSSEVHIGVEISLVELAERAAALTRQDDGTYR